MPVSQLLLSAAKAASNPSAKRTALRGYTSLSGDGESETLTRVALKEITPCSAPSTEPLSTGRAGLKAQQLSGWKGRAFPSVRVGHGAIRRGRDGTGQARTRAEASSRARRGFGPCNAAAWAPQPGPVTEPSAHTDTPARQGSPDRARGGRSGGGHNSPQRGRGRLWGAPPRPRHRPRSAPASPRRSPASPARSAFLTVSGNAESAPVPAP